MAFGSNGSGYPLLFLHGALMSRAMWHPQLEIFGRHYRVIICDLPAHGASADLPGAYTVAAVADQVFSLLGELEVESLHLCGHSLGGMVAQYIAATQPGRINKLVLAETAFGTQNSFQERVQTALARPFLKLTPQNVLVAAASRRYGSLRPEVAEFIRSEMGSYRHSASVRIMNAALGFAGKTALAEIEAPTLVLIGGENLQTHAQGRELAWLIPNARLVAVSKAHHLLNLDNPDVFNEIVLDFLQS